MIKAQELYDMRESTGFVSGTDLYAFFEHATGNPSPSALVEIDSEIVKTWIVGMKDDLCMAGAAYAYHSRASDELAALLRIIQKTTAIEFRTAMRASIAARNYNK
jgi:hypothetical protein